MRSLLVALALIVFGNDVRAQPQGETITLGPPSLSTIDWVGGAMCGATIARGSAVLNAESIGMSLVTTTGTGATVTISETNAATATPRIQYTSATSADALAGWSFAAGGGDRLVPGHWDVVRWRFALSSIVSGQAVFVGIQNAAGSWTGDPNALTNTFYVGCDAADSDLEVCANDASGSATCTTLGATFPCKTGALVGYEFLATRAKGTQIYKWTMRKHSGEVATGTISADLPTGTIRLNPKAQCSARSSGAACVIHTADVFVCGPAY